MDCLIELQQKFYALWVDAKANDSWNPVYEQNIIQIENIELKMACFGMKMLFNKIVHVQKLQRKIHIDFDESLKEPLEQILEFL